MARSPGCFYCVSFLKSLLFVIIFVKVIINGGLYMSLTMYWYPNCGSCKKAKKWFDDHEIDYQLIHIVEDPPNEETLKDLIEKSGLEAKKFFNTSGKVYREQNMKEKIKDATVDEMVGYLASNGMLIKRPIVTDGKKVTVGFKEETFENTWGN